MNIRIPTIAVLMLVALRPAYVIADDDIPRPIPLTRPAMKQMLEEMKVRRPRIPLPELTDADRNALGDRADSYESRLRHHYLGGDTSRRSTAGTGGSRGREQDPMATLDYGFKVELFWIVSRMNNCHYCLGHQESKLLAAGRDEDRIARLDGDWADFTDAERAAFEFARKVTYQPHMLTDRDLVGMKDYYSDLQIIEIIISLAWNNSINRWKEAIGVPQNADEGGFSRLEMTAGAGATSPPAVDTPSLPRGSYLTPTSPSYATQITHVAPIYRDATTDQLSNGTVCIRPELESREEVVKQLQSCRSRTARLPLASVASTREVMSLTNEADVPNWLRLLAHFPQEGKRRGEAVLDAIHDEHLSPIFKAQLAWIVARQDRAWYMLGHAHAQLTSLGYTEDEIFSLDDDSKEFSEREQALFRLAKHLAASPVVLTDRDVARCVELAGPGDAVRTIQHVTQLSALNRITEAAGLPLEGNL